MAKKITTEEKNKKVKAKTKEKVNKTDKVIETKKVEEKEQSPIVSLMELLGIIAFVVVVLIFFPNTIIWNIIVLLLILTVLIFVHEFGHYITGKMCGVHIYEFALGMGPKVLEFKRKNDPTIYTLRAFPIGGYCQLAGEELEDDDTLPKDKFMCNKSKLQRLLILVAGVTMNFITAFILLFLIGLCFGSTDQSNRIAGVEKDSVAYEAGIVAGDKIVECNGYKITTWDKLSVVTAMKNENDYIEYVIEHKDGSKDTYQLIPADYVTFEDKMIRITDEITKEDILEYYGKTEDEVVISQKIGVSSSSEKLYGISNAFKYACTKFISIVSMMLMIIWGLITGKIGLNALSGPVGMYSIVGEVARAGFANIIYLAAYLSINLGVLNILPIPAFDGGRVLFVLIEAVTGKKVDAKIEAIIHSVCFVLLMILMLVITCQDILRLLF